MLRFILSVFLLFILLSVEAQVPQGTNYQAVLRNDQGAALANKQVNIRATVLRIATNTIVYRETMLTNTNEFGLINVIIGKGTPVTGLFKDVQWENGGLKLRIELDPDGGSLFRSFGETDFQTVPYAFTAETALNIESTARINPSQINGGGALSGQVLRWNGSQWAPSNESGGGTVNVSPRLSGNGSAGSPLDIARQGADIGQVLKWDGANWSPGQDFGNNYVEGTGIIINNGVISARNTQAIWNASQLRGRPVLDIAPQNNQFMVWDGFAWAPTTVPVGLALPYDGSYSSSNIVGFRLTNSDGTAINGRGIVGVRATYTGAGAGAALEVQNGGIRVTGSNKPSFQVNGTGNIVINSPLCNNNPIAMLFVTQINPNPAVNTGQYPFSIAYDFLESRWYIISDPLIGFSYNVLIINQ
jgi:hypothetical protein